MPVALGRNGIAAKDAKKEGDGYTPSGIYLITTAFGYTDQINTKLNYRKVTDNDFWVDDINSPQYNQWVSGRPQAQSFEEMRRKDNLYAQGAIIEYNTNPIVPGKGSAIFLHIWRNYYKPTAGCVATSQRNIRRLLQWLDKDKGAMIVLFKA
jgi:L,D-peptidoglycan transpeptidase YkuD (ErfK/YbiS/YcfS/YnhG family)